MPSLLFLYAIIKHVPRPPSGITQSEARADSRMYARDCESGVISGRFFPFAVLLLLFDIDFLALGKVLLLKVDFRVRVRDPDPDEERDVLAKGADVLESELELETVGTPACFGEEGLSRLNAFSPNFLSKRTLNDP